MKQGYIERIRSFPNIEYAIRSIHGELVETGFESSQAAEVWARLNGWEMI